MPTTTPEPQPTLAEVSQRVRGICRDADLEEPDLVIGCDGEFVALWFGSRLAMVVESGDQDKAEARGLGPGAGWIDPEHNPDVIEAIELIARLCADNDFPLPDRIAGSEEGRKITFIWSGPDGFDATWVVEELVRSGRQARDCA